MAKRFLAGSLLFGLAGCELSLGKGDIAEFRFDALAEVGLFKGGGAVEIARDVVFIPAERSQRYLAKYGPDKIGAIVGVTLMLVDAHVEGAPEGAFVTQPVVQLDGQTFRQVGATVELDDAQVDQVRSRLLVPTEVRAPLTITLQVADPSTLAAAPASLHIVVVIQPILHVDATKSF